MCSIEHSRRDRIVKGQWARQAKAGHFLYSRAVKAGSHSMIFALLFMAGIPTAEAGAAAGVGVMLNNGDALTQGLGARGLVQIGSGRTKLEAVAGYTPDRGVGNLSGLTHALVAIAAGTGDGGAGFVQPVDHQAFSVSGLFDWSVVEPMQFSPTWVVSPHLLGGGGVVGFQTYSASYDDSSGTPGTVLELSQKSVRLMAQAGMSLEIWAQSKWGIRFATIDQVHVAPKPQYDPNVPVAESQMYHRVKSSIDLLVQFK
jgi:hypothetical protein